MKKQTGEQTYELKYTGYLMNADSMYLHYGYENWSNVTEKKMKKLKSCYKIEVSVPEGNELNFCFRANENEWDNNGGNNYWFTHNSEKIYDCVEITCKATEESKTKTTTTKTTATKSIATKTATAKAKSTNSTSTASTKKKELATKTAKK